MFEQRFRQFIAEHDLLPVDTPVLVAVSGGVDSVVLLHLLERHYASCSDKLTVAHLDHSLCPESRQAAAQVADLCNRLCLPLVTETVQIEPSGAGLEAAARDQRYAFLHRVAETQGCDRIVLAHHRDDQAETFLYRLTRGSGPGGLTAMRPRTGPLVRPLLFATRDEIQAWAQAQGLHWWDDPGNDKLTQDRNRLRHRVMPELRQINPRVADALSQLADQFATDERFWQQQVASVLPDLTEAAEGGLTLNLPLFCQLPEALQSRVLRACIASVRGTLNGIGRRHLQAVCALVEADRPQAEVQLPGLWVARRYTRLWLRRQPPGTPMAYQELLQPNQQTRLPSGQSIDVEMVTERGADDRWICECDPDVLRQGLVVRSWRPGDRIRLPNAAGRTKLQDLFTDLKLTVEQRSHQPVVISGQEVLWLPGLRRSCLAPAPPLEKPCLRLTFHP